MKEKTSWFVKLWALENPDQFGIGECSPLPGLSVDAREDYEECLRKFLDQFLQTDAPSLSSLYSNIPVEFPSIRMGFETALLDLLGGGKRLIYQSGFLQGKKIPINGLIWMGDLDFMMTQINEKIAKGFRCIKLKVGGLDFDRECDVLDYIRKRYFRENITIRLDANGAFKIDDVLFRLEQLARYNVHSIEQPIRVKQDAMEELCRKSPIPVGLDEELIGVHHREEKLSLLKRLQPAYIILKPSLHGGFVGCREWIELAEQTGVGWWITSALESSIGLNAICQFTAQYPITLYQGLGTGSIYTHNFSSPLTVAHGEIFLDSQSHWNEQEFKGDAKTL